MTDKNETPYYLRDDVGLEAKTEYYKLMEDEWKSRQKRLTIISVVLLLICCAYLIGMSLWRGMSATGVSITAGEGITAISCFACIFFCGKYMLMGRNLRPVELNCYESWLKEQKEVSIEQESEEDNSEGRIPE